MTDGNVRWLQPAAARQHQRVLYAIAVSDVGRPHRYAALQSVLRARVVHLYGLYAHVSVYPELHLMMLASPASGR
jgi:hypothetical protein